MDFDIDDPRQQVETDLETQSLLLASANYDIPAIKNLLKTTPATVQDPETGFTPLHAAIAACEEDADDKTALNGNYAEERERELEAAAETVRMLFQNGAIWNDLDANNETPGCLAKRLGLQEIYRIVVDAGVRAEMLLARLDGYQFLGDGDGNDDDEEKDEQKASVEAQDDSVREDIDPSSNNEAYIRGQIAISDTNILDSVANGVMMSWEKPIMERHASLLLPKPGLRVLNVGHGMGIIDDFFQSRSPSSHHIIEAHPAVLTKMRDNGWYDKPGVVIHEGRWQDTLSKLIMGGEGDEEIPFDAIYFDTFAEEYKALREFFSEWVVQLLDSEGRMSFFNGMGADRQVCYDVYNQVAEMDLFEAGFDVEWEDIAVPDLSEAGEWKGVKRPYWALTKYRLPTCKFLS